jgi:hypothetical protein
MRAKIERERYNAALKTKVVKYLGCTISYKNPVGYGYFAVKTPWGSPFNWIDGETYKSIAKAKEAIKRVHERMTAK